MARKQKLLRRPHPLESCHCWGVAAHEPSDPAFRHAKWCPAYGRRYEQTYPRA